MAFAYTYERWKHLPVHDLIIETEQFIVFLDQALDVDWQTTDEYDRVHEKEAAERAVVHRQVAYLQALSLVGLERETCLGFRRLLGGATARAFESAFDEAKMGLDEARKFILMRSEEAARRWYLTAALVAATALGIALCLVFAGCAYVAPSPVAAFWLKIIPFAGAGMAGAVLSMMQRTSKLPVNATAGRAALHFEGFLRTILGLLSGTVIAIAMKAGIVFSVFEELDGERSFYLSLLGALAAGFSERLVPAMVARFEKLAVETMPDGK